MRHKALIVCIFMATSAVVYATPEEGEFSSMAGDAGDSRNVGAARGDSADGSIPGKFFLQGSEDGARPVALPSATETVRRVRLFDRQVSYRNDRKACVAFELPVPAGEAVRTVDLTLEAYNDDSTYLRAVWFEIDGIGGYIGVSKVAEGQHRGNGTIAPRETKRWRFGLDRFPVALNGELTSEVDFAGLLARPGPHTVCSWISTYAQYGPNSWITMDMEIVTEARGRR